MPGKVELSWTDSSNSEDGFMIERKQEASEYTIIASVPANTVYNSLILM